MTGLAERVDRRNVETGLAVFMPNYNHGRFLPEALDALLAQSLRPKTIYIVDDASTDGSHDVIESYLRRYPDIIKAEFLKEHRGLVANVTRWLASSDDEFILFAAADDKAAPGLLEKSISLLRRFPNAGFCSAGSRLIDEQGHDLGRFRNRWPLAEPGMIPPHCVRALLMAADGWFMGNTTVYRGSALRSVGFVSDLGAFADGFTCRVLALRYGACFIPEDLSGWRRMPSGIASQSIRVPAQVHSIIACAMALMTGPFASDFPAEYARRWRQRWLFAALISAYARSTVTTDKTLREILAPLALPDRLVLWALRLLPYKLAGLAAFLWLRPFDIPMAVRDAVRSWGKMMFK